MKLLLPIILLSFEYGWSITIHEEEEGTRTTSKKSVNFFPGPAAESNYVNFTDSRDRYRTESREPRAETERKGDPDIKDILTGFVKLFNSPDSASRRRINNRGPPRISDFPPFVLDPLSSPAPTRDPPPYPFEKPLQKVVVKPYATGVPLPEQIVPPPRPSKYPPKPIPTKSSATKQDLKKTSKPDLPKPDFPLPQEIQTPVFEPRPTLVFNSSSAAPVNPSPTESITPLSVGNISQTSEPSTTEPVPSSPETTTSAQETSSPTSSPEVLLSSELPAKGSVNPTPVLESSLPEQPTSKEPHKETTYISSSASSTTPYKSFTGRPGIVLDDTEYKPAGAHARPIITAPVPDRGDFDITVSAVQGPLSTYGTPHIFPVELEGVNLPGEVSVITKADGGQHYVSIDGKRTYINLFGTSASSNSAQIKPTSVKSNQPFKSSQGTYTVTDESKKNDKGGRRPLPPVRIDTCIVGDWSTCDAEQHETCRTEYGVSSCHCAPAYSRLSHRQPCKRIVSLFTSMNLEKLYDQKLKWTDKYLDRDSQEFLELEYEAVKAMQSALSMTPFSDIFMGSKVNSVYTRDRRDVLMNVTLMLESSPQTQRTQVRQELEKEIIGAIRRRNFNIGTSNLWASQKSTVARVQDLDECSSPELNDCFIGGQCRNTFGSFECSCPDGYLDEFASSPLKAGRRCETCGADHCNHRGTCSYSPSGQPVCLCTGNYYGSQCEVDGEVLGVAIGASVAAVIIILSTLACLCMWSRKWNKEAKEIGLRSVFGYVPTMPSACPTMKSPGMGVPPYTVSMEDRLRWAQIADAIATNHYAPEPVATRPPSAMFRYGTLPVAPLCLPGLGMRPGSIQNLRPESSSEEEDRVDLLDNKFSVPRPKSRASLANQSGIYYDVDYDQQQEQLTSVKQGAIPLSTYTLASRSHYGYH